MINLLVVVQRCPAVPTAPNTQPINAISRSASFDMMMALLPPSSKMVFPSLAATAVLTALPMRVEPVADKSGTRVSLHNHSPTSLPPCIKPFTPSGTLFFSNTSATIFCTAIPHKGVFSLGFQMLTLPQTHDSALFHAHTATGKLKADIMATIPTGCHCSYMRCAGR